MYKNFKSCLPSIISLVFIMGCSVPADLIEDPMVLADPVLEIPVNVVSEFIDGKIQISWTAAEGAAEYYIYRKEGDSDFSLINSSATASFSDRGYRKDRIVQYTVKSVNGIMRSDFSSPSAPLKEWISNSRVSVLEFTDKIRITWEHQPGADEYVISRSASPDSILSERARIPVSENIIAYEDDTSDVNGPMTDTSYFYHIHWFKDGILYGSDRPASLGVFSDSIDSGEPFNNDYLIIGDGNYIQDSGFPPYLYSFGDGFGGIDADTDWYQYVGYRGEDVTINIVKPSVFNEIELQYYYNGEYSDPIVISSENNPYNYIYSIPDPDSTAEETILYFKIKPVSTIEDSIFGPYSVTISSDSFDPTDPVDPADQSEWVKDPAASILEYRDRIRLSWGKVLDVDEYIVYRSGSRDTAPVEIARFSDSAAYIEYHDYSPRADTPYYYQVRWMNDSIEYGSASPLVLGVYSGTVDINEPLNNDYSTLNSGSYVPDIDNPSILYSFNDGNGLIEADTDWYRYDEGKTGDALFFTIEKPDQFESVNLQFYHKGVFSEIISISGNDPHQELFSIPDPDFLQEDTVLYFRIFPVSGISNNIIGTYNVAVSNSL